jgi:hypothetical protein
MAPSPQSRTPNSLLGRASAQVELSGPVPRAELLHVLRLPDFDRADAIGEYWGNPKTRTFAELVIDCEEDRTLRAVLVVSVRRAQPYLDRLRRRLTVEGADD